MITQPEQTSPPAAELPTGLERDRHLSRGQHTPWPRRIVVALLAAFCIAALANVFGQVSAVRSVDVPKATLRVDSPERLRAGLIFTSVITISSHQQFQDLRLVLGPGWFDGMTLNAMAPQSSQEESNNQGVIFDYGQVDANAITPVWTSWQTNPITVGRRVQDVSLYDGSTLVAAVHRDVIVYP